MNQTVEMKHTMFQLTDSKIVCLLYGIQLCSGGSAVWERATLKYIYIV